MNHIGVPVTSELDLCLTLYSLYHNIPKAQTVRQALGNWIKNTDSFQEKMIMNLIEKIRIDWNTHVEKRKVDARIKHLSTQEFLLDYQHRLRKLPTPIREHIINSVFY